MEEKAPRSEYGHVFREWGGVFYGTDDGHPDPRPDFVFDEKETAGEFEAFEAFYRGVGRARRRDVHLLSVVGGFYGLNLVPLFRPTEITFFDVNPHQITYSRLILRVLLASRSAKEFLGRLSTEDYEVFSESERSIRHHLALKQQGRLPASCGTPKRTLHNSWRYALDRFELTRAVLRDAAIRTRVEGMQEASFQDFVRHRRNLWIFCSNVFLFVYFKLVFSCPENVALFATYFSDVEVLDLAARGASPVEVRCRIPMSAEVVRPGVASAGGE